jgi:hypothetical protein
MTAVLTVSGGAGLAPRSAWGRRASVRGAAQNACLLRIAETTFAAFEASESPPLPVFSAACLNNEEATSGTGWLRLAMQRGQYSWRGPRIASCRPQWGQDRSIVNSLFYVGDVRRAH